MGLINTAMQGTGDNESMEAQGAPEPGEGMSQEKEAQVKEAYRIGKNMLYRKDVFDGLMKQIGDATPAAAMAEAIVMLLEKIQESMQLPFDVLLSAGITLLADLAEAMNETGRFTVSEKDIGDAVQMGISMYLQAHGEKFDRNQIAQQYQQGLQAIGGAA